MPASCVSDEAMYDWQEPHSLAGTAMYLQECPSLKTFLGSNRKQRSNTFLEKKWWKWYFKQKKSWSSKVNL